MFIPFRCADCDSKYAPIAGGCACNGCGDILPWADLMLEWGEVAMTRNGFCGYTHEDDCTTCEDADGETFEHPYSPA